jgi:glycosyltransferase involved in cell wall biosynthesis
MTDTDASTTETRRTAPTPVDDAGSDARTLDTTLRPEFEVLIVGPSNSGGIASYVEEQTRRLGGTVTTRVHDSGAPPIGSGWRRFLRGLLTSLFAFLRFPLRDRPDVVHVHTSHRFSFYRKAAYALFAKYVWGVPLVLHVHGSSFDEFVATDSQAVATLQRLVFGASDEVIVLSEYWKDRVGVRTDPAKVRVVPNAIDPGAFRPDPTDETPRIAFVSSLIERKGVDELAAAIEELSRRRPGGFEVDVAGAGPLSDRVERLEADCEAVTYHGYVSERRKRSLLSEASVYVLPTHAEGLPIAMLEGMAGANAVVSTDVGSIPEVVGEDNGRLVAPGDVEGLTDALEELVSHPGRRRRMAETNRRLVEERYSWHSALEQLVAVYETHAG